MNGTASKRDIHGHAVFGDESAKKGLDYLDYSLQLDEVEVFFHQAKTQGSAEFEDAKNNNYTLSYNGDGTYTLTGRKADGSSWF